MSAGGAGGAAGALNLHITADAHQSAVTTATMPASTITTASKAQWKLNPLLSSSRPLSLISCYHQKQTH